MPLELSQRMPGSGPSSLQSHHLWWLLLFTLLPLAPLASAAEARPAINVLLFFDTEDYLSPGDDDATLRLCQLLTAKNIRATFKIVGEKARVLEQRGRQDVISALKRHDIGYHSNLHSVHPTPTEYLAECGWLDGIAEFICREGGGAADVRRIFGLETLSCYGQPGSSWGPQAIAALPAIGIAPHGVPCYVDVGKQIGLNQRPFWYAGALNVYGMGSNFTRLKLHDPAAVEPARQKFAEIAGRLSREGGGLMSSYYHPCEWIHKEFWDAFNFSHGANPPRENWKAPPQRSAAETDAAFRLFSDYLDSVLTIPGIRWITASDLPLLYPDRTRTEGAPSGDLDQITERIGSSRRQGLDIISIGPRSYSLADQFELLTDAIHETGAGHRLIFPLKTSGLMGPDAKPPMSNDAATNITGFALRDTIREVYQFLATQHRIPARVFIGARAVAPADFLLALAHAWDFHRRTGKLPSSETIPLGEHACIIPEKQAASDTPDLFGGWIIHRAGFQAPALMEQARLQTWTLKPALQAPPAEQ